MEGPDAHDRGRTALRAAVLRDAVRLAEARDVLVVRLADLDEASLVEALVCGEHWTSEIRLDLLHEPLVLQAFAGDRLVRCCPRRPRRICGPYWSSAAMLVPHRDPGADPLVVVLAGGAQQPCPERAREAAATVAQLVADTAPARDDGGWGVLVVRTSETPAGAAALAPALAAIDAVGARVLRTGVRELCVLIPTGGAVSCERVANGVRSAVRVTATGSATATEIGVGWAVGAPPRPVASAIDVARAMAEHDKRAARAVAQEDD